MMKTPVRVSLQVFLTVLAVVQPEEVNVRVGDMVALYCPRSRSGQTEPPTSWTTPHERDLTTNMSSSVFVTHERSLILLSASMEHQGNYSCSTGNQTFWTKLVVSDVDQTMAQYPTTCYSQRRCTLRCPVSNSPRSDTPNMTQLGITWEKDGRSQLRDVMFFSSVEEKDEGTFTCTRSYLYKGQRYNMTFTVALSVKPQEPLPKVELIAPHEGDVFEVNVGSFFAVNCTATISSVFDEVYWIMDKSSVKSDPTQRVFSNRTTFIVPGAKGSIMTTSLVFSQVLKEDLSKDLTCKLESVSAASSWVTVSLKPKKQETSVFLPVIIVAMILVAAVIALTCVKFKMDIFLCLRDRFCTKFDDSKPVDASLVGYKSDSETALSEDDTKWLENVLEQDLGYKLHLHLYKSTGEEKPVEVSADQSHVVILVPVSSPGPDCSFTDKDSSSLDSSSACVILIQTETERKSRSAKDGPLLGHAEQTIVTWRGTVSKTLSSSFIKHLRFHLPPPQRKQERRISEIL